MPIPLAEAEARRPLRPEDFGDWTSYYFAYQRVLTQEYLLPVLGEWGFPLSGARVLDVGCGDGGASVALALAGAEVHGFDLDDQRVVGARERAEAHGVSIHAAVADITQAESLRDFDGPYDLILFRDVLEHIPEAATALTHARERLAEGGQVVVIYPPYFSPYGGHQQILRTRRRLAKLPFVHWLPESLFAALVGADRDVDPQWDEVRTIRRARLSLRGMQRLAAECGLARAHVRRYLLRPTFRLRYGTPVVRANGLDRVPGLREICITGSYESFRIRTRRSP